MSPTTWRAAPARAAAARWLTRLAAVGAALVLALTVAPAPAAHAISSTTFEKDVHTLANKERAKRGLARVSHSPCLDRYAEAQAKAMAQKKKMYHQDLQPILRACKLSTVGENVARGYSSGSSVTKAWMNSPGHRANILGSRYRSIGVGAYQDSKGTWYVAQVLGRFR